jgi:ubiquinone/menaquinone biosynthesis C-methylase UbiE
MTTNKSDFPYLHGFSETEQNRLRQQARFAEHTIYRDINLSNVKNLLEVGCGVGAQSEIILRRFPELNLHGIDLSDKQLQAAKTHLSSLPGAKSRFTIEKMNAEKMNFDSNSFDGAFLCWVLEHIPNPANVLSEVRRVLSPGSTVHITEVLNSSFFLDPYSPSVWKFWMAFNDYQFENAGDPFVGAKLGNLLMSLGFRDIKTSVKTWHLDNREPEKRKETIDFWTDLLMSGADQLINEKVITKELAEETYKELKAVASNPNAVFFYSFVQASAKVF